MKNLRRRNCSKHVMWHEPCLFIARSSVYLAAIFLVLCLSFFSQSVFFAPWRHATISIHCPAPRLFSLFCLHRNTATCQLPPWERYWQSAKIIKNQTLEMSKASATLYEKTIHSVSLLSSLWLYFHLTFQDIWAYFYFVFIHNYKSKTQRPVC